MLPGGLGCFLGCQPGRTIRCADERTERPKLIVGFITWNAIGRPSNCQWSGLMIFAPIDLFEWQSEAFAWLLVGRWLGEPQLMLVHSGRLTLAMLTLGRQI